MTSQEGIYAADGFGFWGHDHGIRSAMLITDLINGQENEFFDLFNPGGSHKNIEFSDFYFHEFHGK